MYLGPHLSAVLDALLSLSTLLRNSDSPFGEPLACETAPGSQRVHFTRWSQADASGHRSAAVGPIMLDF